MQSQMVSRYPCGQRARSRHGAPSGHGPEVAVRASTRRGFFSQYLLNGRCILGVSSVLDQSSGDLQGSIDHADQVGCDTKRIHIGAFTLGVTSVSYAVNGRSRAL